MVPAILLRLKHGAINALLGLILCLFGAGAWAQDFILFGSTTSLENSGFIAHIGHHFNLSSGLDLRVVAAGTGQILHSGSQGNLDILFVHAPSREQAFMKAGHGFWRQEIMRNRFLLVGPREQKTLRSPTIEDALHGIADDEITFLSRGDQSGTHMAEQNLWQAAGLYPVGAWYITSGLGMGAALRMASDLEAITMVDQATWYRYRDKVNLHPIYQGEDRLLNNIYSLIITRAVCGDQGRMRSATKFVEWLSSDQGRRAMADFQIAGHQPFIITSTTPAQALPESCPADVD